jgi:serine protease Do
MKVSWKRLAGLSLALVIVIAASGCTFTGKQGPQGVVGPAGASISSATVNNKGHLILTLSDGKSLDAGSVVGPQGPAGSTFTSIVPQVEPSIVRIDVTVARGLDSGSGTIVDKRGYITTNAHVVNGAQSIQVTLKDGTVLAATTVGIDTKQDLAIIKLTTARTDFPVMPLGTVSDILVGEPAMAMGFPAGTSLPGPATFTAGVVSAMREYNGANYIQIDTPVNPGNSGGCLFTLQGKMIGIPSAGITPSNQDFEDINLAIPIDQVSAFIALYVK